MPSIGTMIKQIGALAGTKDVGEWEDKFITDMVRLTDDGRITTALSHRQVEKVEQIFHRHFA